MQRRDFFTTTAAVLPVAALTGMVRAVEPAPANPPRRQLPIGVSTYSFWRFQHAEWKPIDRCLQAAAELGFNGVELLQRQLSDTESSPAGLREIKRRAQSLGMPLMGYSTHQGFVSPEEAQRRSAIMVRQSLAFAQIVTILLRSPSHRHFAIADLEWLVVPPLTLGQFVIAEAKAQADGPGFPVAMALWATVSPETDLRLSENLTSPIRLRPDEWKSGDIMWLIDAVGEPRVLTGLVQQLAENAFKGRPIKLRQVGEGGKTIVAVLGGQAPAAA